jgi:hypothetical protein
MNAASDADDMDSLDDGGSEEEESDLDDPYERLAEPDLRSYLTSTRSHPAPTQEAIRKR